MGDPATITVTRGPARGEFFELSEELVHIGRGEGNQLVLADDDLAEHQASIAFRNGRYAIFSLLPDSVSIDGSPIPSERWVWLPETAEILLGSRTGLRFSRNGVPADEGNSEEDNSEEATDTATSTTAREGKRSRRRKRQVARIITDSSGEARVQLGEDGQLPELALDEDMTGGQPSRERSGSNRLLLYLLVAASSAGSLLLLVMEGPVGRSSNPGQLARSELKTLLPDKPTADTPRWQLLIWEALAANSRNDRAGEQRALASLRDLLNAEDLGETGLTGNINDDQKLRKHVARLIRTAPGNRRP